MSCHEEYESLDNVCVMLRSDQLVMTPVWRLSNGHGPSWHFGQAQVTTDTSFQVRRIKIWVIITIMTINSQVIIEGIWGTPRASGYLAVDDVTFYDGECGALPATASVTRGACSFDRDSCGWRNTSTVTPQRFFCRVIFFNVFCLQGGDIRLADGDPDQEASQPPRQDIRGPCGLRLL